MVTSEKLTDQEPFWVDEQIARTFRSHSITKFSRTIRIYNTIFHWLVFVGLVLIVWFYMSKLLALVIAFMLLAAIVLGYIQTRRNKSVTDHAKLIQKRAREHTGADLIGSAVHVAGYPKLEQNQPVVLALTKNALVIYPYDKPNVLDKIDTREIDAIQTVVYDEDRIPHIEVIDPCSQALQLRITRQDISWQCLFNRMRSVRPIDWYHAIQKAKVN